MMEEAVDFEIDADENTKIIPDKHVASAPPGGDDSISSNKVKRKGRGHKQKDEEAHNEVRGGVYDSLGDNHGPLKSVEGWIIFVSNVHQEAQEEDILDKFAEYGEVKNIHVNLDRRTGFVKGYALLEFESFDEAVSAIKNMNGKELLGQIVEVDWAFVKNR